MKFILLFFLAAIVQVAGGQMITGVWKGKINRQKVELKIIQSGDSLTGTSYYYESPSSFRRYSIKGYFDASTNSTVWWDDQLIEEKTKITNGTGKVPLLARADFNCPGGGVMMLDGKAALREDNSNPRGELHLDKIDSPLFSDEWNYVIDNYLTGANDPDIIDSVGAIAAGAPKTQPLSPIPVIAAPPANSTAIESRPREKPVAKAAEQEERVPASSTLVNSKAPNIETKFLSRKKVFNKEIELTGDSIELRFYDNAEVDGDSISLFLNNQLIFEHIRLTEKAYVIKLAVGDLQENNELTMVAENLGSIPPNTSYMLAIVGDKRYDAYLASTEDSSAMIRFVKKKRS